MDYEQRIKNLEKEIATIKLRNLRVEEAKAWETSLLRKVAIIILTYVLMCLVMASLDVEKFYLNALVPTLGFFLSTLSLSFVKRLWQKSK